ncbi:MAG: hypothetical protein FJY37_11080 [Betaproteobacteria bacterium]|nr:hypothetical protein [Betaproteobacteria bacterium]
MPSLRHAVLNSLTLGVAPAAAQATALLAVTTAALALASGSARAETVCPDTLAVRQTAEVPSGWQVTMSEQPPRLASVTLFDGQPANRASLKFTKRQSSGGELRLTWMLPETPRSIYLQCGYERTAALISAPLPPGTTRCDVVFDTRTSYPSGASVIKRMVCK